MLSATRHLGSNNSNLKWCHLWIFLLALIGHGPCYSTRAINSEFTKKTPGGAATTLQIEILHKAAQVRELVGKHPPPYVNDKDILERVLFFDSSYESNGDHERGFCNWLLPGRIMIGQYPGQTPETNGPTPEAVVSHMKKVCTDGDVRLFCSLQSELPPQDDYVTWNKREGRVFLEPEHVRRRFPRPFTHYAPLVDQVCQNSTMRPPQFIHSPIEDLNVPESQEPLQNLLLELLTYVVDHESGKTPASIYLHCWGGRGRAGLVGACLLTLIWPSLNASAILDWIQIGYASRLGHYKMASTLSMSPQTSSQRDFVKRFVQDYQRLHDTYNGYVGRKQ